MSHRTLAALGVVFRGFGILFQGETDGQTWTIIFERRGSRKLSSLPPFPPLNLDVRCFPLQVKNISCGPFCSTKLETEGTLSSCCYSQTVSVLSITHQKLTTSHRWTFWVLFHGLLLLCGGAKEDRTGHWSHCEGWGLFMNTTQRIRRKNSWQGKWGRSWNCGLAPTRDNFTRIEWLPRHM